jgi:membrane-associated phospholipid phosphatase
VALRGFAASRDPSSLWNDRLNRVRNYTFIDYVTQGYNALVGVIILLLHGDAVPGWVWLVGGHMLCALFIHALISASTARPANRVLDFLRHFYPVILYAAFYRETASLNQIGYRGYLDPFFYRLDEQLFGFAPSFTFMERFPTRLASEVFYGAYFSYYVMIFGVGLALYLRNRRQFDHYIAVTSFVFYVCYVAYIFMPVIGPRIYYPEFVHFTLPADAMPAHVPIFPAAVESGVFYRIMEFVYDHFEAPGAAFPSSHVAIAVVTVYFSFRYLRTIRWVHLVMAVLLCLSTVYCRYHFVVDVIAGLLTAALMLPLGNWLYWRLGPKPLESASDRRKSNLCRRQSEDNPSSIELTPKTD